MIMAELDQATLENVLSIAMRKRVLFEEEFGYIFIESK